MKSMNDDLTFPELANQVLHCDSQIFLAYDAQQAVQLVEHLGGAVTVVDLDSKGRDGLLLMQKLRERFPDLPVIAISSVLGVP